MNSSDLEKKWAREQCKGMACANGKRDVSKYQQCKHIFCLSITAIVGSIMFVCLPFRMTCLDTSFSDETLAAAK